MTSPLRRKSTTAPALAEQVYIQIKRELFAFRLLPGERFSENDIVRLTGASRTPVREALNRLAREGFVTVQNRAGWRVRDLDFAVFDQLYEVRTLIELSVVERLAARPPLTALDRLNATWQVAPAARRHDGESVFALDEAFHAELVAASGNEELARIHQGVTERIRIVRQLDFTEPHRIAATYEEHGAILKAIGQQQPAEARRLMQAHIETSRQEVRKISLHRLYEAREQARLKSENTPEIIEPATGGHRSDHQSTPNGGLTHETS
ncbi:GntR family transcriptional regulator [Halothiobacillus diazotrophicus]|uniref:GntR family transcriptional regulator n=1 Tax=Halothiobacillus diazotrophicus TaxID=1860122 RepID=A0A191ZDQ1_9GAMM|nr:GntR family transcriptional regulator [Halothiobacillus diazotrophicus]ANJ65995.1 GntR family transcriptional regulator [Halothiobacillus diazotrophicus]